MFHFLFQLFNRISKYVFWFHFIGCCDDANTIDIQPLKHISQQKDINKSSILNIKINRIQDQLFSSSW